ncbi:MAG TPA: glycine zipper 2TM domain-containing protein [Burkholderiales bacterium]|nr:glycine zipper 2TM domain-containing protein [Burkholderiales bacterium]
MDKPNNILNTVLIVSGIAVTLFSLLGIATIAGWLPHAHSQEQVASAVQTVPTPAVSPGGAMTPPAQPIQNAPIASPYQYREGYPRRSEARREERPVLASAGSPAVQAPPVCPVCGVVQAINVTEVQSANTSVVGTVLGGVLGAVVGHQIGNGNGRTLATVAGAAGGAYAGDKIGQRVNQHQRFIIHVRMDDGTYRTFYLSAPPSFNTGDRVRLENGTLIPMQA